MNSKRWLLILTAVLILPGIWPLLRMDFFRMHDFTHVARLVEMHRALLDGQFPPRWSDNFGFGYGMPLLHFYAPLAYYIAEGLHLLFIPPVWAIKVVVILNFVAGFIWMYCLAKEFWGKWGGMIAAVAFIYAPYRAAQFYVRGSLAEMTAMTFLPLALWGLYRLVLSTQESVEPKKKQESNKPRSFWVVLSVLGISGIFLSHNVIALFSVCFLPLWTVGWAIFYILRCEKQKVQYLVRLLISGLVVIFLSFFLSAWFLVPAFFEKNYTIVDSIGGGYSYYKLHFIYLRQLIDPTFEYGGSILGPEDDISFQLGLVQLAFASIAGISLGAIWLTKKIWQKSIIHALTYTRSQFYMVSMVGMFLLLSIYLMTFHSIGIWEQFPILHIAQFPWRFLAFSACFLSLLSGGVGWLLQQLWPQGRYIGLMLLVGLVLGFNIAFFQPQAYSSVDDYYYTQEEKIQKQMSDILRDYLPIWVKTVPKPGLERTRVASGSATVATTIHKQGLRTFKVQAQEPFTLEVSTFYFPGWKAFLDRQEIAVTQSEPHGFISIPVPAGNHELKVQLTKTALQFWSDTLSGITLLGLLLWWGKQALRL